MPGVDKNGFAKKLKDPLLMQIMFKALMIRHEKSQKLDGRDIMVLPAKHERVRTVKFSKKERRIYNALHLDASKRFEEIRAKGGNAVSLVDR